MCTPAAQGPCRPYRLFKTGRGVRLKAYPMKPEETTKTQSAWRMLLYVGSGHSVNRRRNQLKEVNREPTDQPPLRVTRFKLAKYLRARKREMTLCQMTAVDGLHLEMAKKLIPFFYMFGFVRFIYLNFMGGFLPDYIYVKIYGISFFLRQKANRFSRFH